MISLINDLAGNLSSEPLYNLRQIVKVMTAEANADSCFIVCHDNGTLRTVISDGGSEMLISQYAFDYAQMHKRGIAVTDKRLLPDRLNAVMCIPIVENSRDDDFKDDKRQKTDNFRQIKGYVYLQGKNDISRFSQTFVDDCGSVVNLLLNCMELYYTFQVASTDKLTGALNRKYMDIALETSLERAKQTSSSFSIIMADLDFFKHVNDTYGHLVGDDVLRDTSRIIRQSLREGDVLGRYGGEEFVVMLNGMYSADAAAFAESLRVKIHAAKILGDKRDITMSLGVATYPEHADTVKMLVEKADKALYTAKKTGRNKFLLWDDRYEDYVIAKDSKQEFFSGDNAKDAKRTLALYKIMETSRQENSLPEKINTALDEILVAAGASDVTLFLIKDSQITDSFRLTEPGRGTPQYNDEIVRRVINGGKPVFMVDWDNDKIDVSTGITDWQSVAVAPAVCNGVMKGVLYAGVSVKSKEFKADEMSFIDNAATLLAAIIR